MTFTAPTLIDLSVFALGTTCLSPAVCANLAEAAALCLVTNGHATGASLIVDAATVKVEWGQLDSRAHGSHADLQDATEEGAVALAIELVRNGTGLDVVRRSRKGTGFDYHLGPRQPSAPFNDAACLEVSGILNEDDILLARRVAQKIAQVAEQGLGLPGYAVIVGFSGPRAVVRSFK